MADGRPQSPLYSHGSTYRLCVISPVGDGSIDIHWKDERRQLLINVPAAGDEPIEFYGDDRGRTIVKGVVDPSASTRWLFAWLTK